MPNSYTFITNYNTKKILQPCHVQTAGRDSIIVSFRCMKLTSPPTEHCLIIEAWRNIREALNPQKVVGYVFNFKHMSNHADITLTTRMPWKYISSWEGGGCAQYSEADRTAAVSSFQLPRAVRQYEEPSQNKLKCEYFFSLAFLVNKKSPRWHRFNSTLEL